MNFQIEVKKRKNDFNIQIVRVLEKHGAYSKDEIEVMFSKLIAYRKIVKVSSNVIKDESPIQLHDGMLSVSLVVESLDCQKLEILTETDSDVCLHIEQK